MSFGQVYPLYVTKLERKGRTSAELDELAKGHPMQKVLRTSA